MHTYFPANEEDGVNLLFLAQFVDVWPIKANKFFKNKINIILSVEKGHMKWCPQRDIYTKAGNEVLNNILKDIQYVRELKRKTKDESDKLIIFCKKIQKLNLSEIKNKDLIDLIQTYNKLYINMISYGLPTTIMEASNDLLTNYLTSLLKKKLVKIKTRKFLADYFQIFINDSYQGEAKNEKIDLLKITIHVKNDKILAQSLIKKHVQKYFWLNYAYEGPILDERYFIKNLKEILSRNDPKKSLQNLIKEELQIKRNRKQAEIKLKLTNKEKQIFAAARDCIFIKIYRKDALTYSLAVMEKVLKEIRKRTRFSLKQIRHCLPKEIKLLFIKNKKQDLKKELNKRINYLAYHVKNKKSIVLTGGKARQFMDKMLIKEIYGDIKIIKGTVASPGTGNGMVRIINVTKDMVKMKKGDILVSIATIPEIVPAMKKASAIVTNIGGITSHAAIVSRELKIPCVIGTKIATKVLKDGDLVEVDANKGVVKKII